MSVLLMTAAELEAFMAREFPQMGPMRLAVEAVDERGIRIRISPGESHLRPGGTLSGPTLMALADTATYLLILSRIGPVALAVTTSLNVNFLRKPPLRDVLAEGRLLKLGKRLAVAEIGMFSDGDPEPVAHATVTYSIPRVPG